MGAFTVLEPGMLTTVQDLGREGHSALGVPGGGAADTLCLRIGNRLVGNPDRAPGLEMTLSGGAFRFESPAAIVLAGADCTPSLERPGKHAFPLHPWTVTAVTAGDTLRTGRPGRGARLYLCIGGGLTIPPVLGSASTFLGAGFGGVGGRALREGDRLEFGAAPARARELPASILAMINEVLDQRTLRAVAGGQADLFDDSAQETFWTSAYTVTAQSNRVGLTLEGPAIGAGTTERAAGAADGRMISEGMPAGVVQVPPGGKPIILLADHPTTGGYPAIACIASLDLPAVGQLRPHNSVRFQRVSQEAALVALREREARLDADLPRAT